MAINSLYVQFARLHGYNNAWGAARAHLVPPNPNNKYAPRYNWGITYEFKDPWGGICGGYTLTIPATEHLTESASVIEVLRDILNPQ